MKVSELSGDALALWTAKALGYELTKDLVEIGEAAMGMRSPVIFYSEAGVLGVAGEGLSGPWRPHEDWAQGGPLLDKFNVSVISYEDGTVGAFVGPVGREEIEEEWIGGHDRLTAACRAIVASKYGEEVPDEKQAD